MGYIGNEPTTGHFPVDNLVGAPAGTYTLTQAPATAGAIEVSVSGVLQPTTAYSVTGTILTMAGVATGVPIFVRHLGETLSLPTPADGSVTDAKIVDVAATKLTGTIAGARFPSTYPAGDGSALTNITHIPANDSVGLNQLAGGTDGNLITFDTAGDPAYVATGTAGQVLTSAGANAVPTFATPAAGGSWTVIGTSEATSPIASLNVEGLDSTYDTYAIALSDVKPTGGGVNPILRLGDSSGVDSGGSDYSWHSQKLTDGSASYSAAVATGQSYISLCGNEAVGQTGGRGFGALLFLHQPGDGTVFPHISGHYSFTDHSSNLYGGMVIGNRLAVITTDRVFFSFNGTNTASGRMTVWGIAHA